MGYGAAACNTTILSQSKLHEFFDSLDLKLDFQGLDELYQSFSELTPSDFVDCFESKDFVESLYEYLDEPEDSAEKEEFQARVERVQSFLSILAKAEEKTNLSFFLIWVGDEGDRYDDLSNEFAIEIGGVYQRTPAGEKYAEYLHNVSWVVYG